MKIKAFKCMLKNFNIAEKYQRWYRWKKLKAKLAEKQVASMNRQRCASPAP